MLIVLVKPRAQIELVGAYRDSFLHHVNSTQETVYHVRTNNDWQQRLDVTASKMAANQSVENAVRMRGTMSIGRHGGLARGVSIE